MITTRQKLTRYSGSLAIVLGVHAVAILLALNWSSPCRSSCHPRR